MLIYIVIVCFKYLFIVIFRRFGKSLQIRRDQKCLSFDFEVFGKFQYYKELDFCNKFYFNGGLKASRGRFLCLVCYWYY